MTNVPLTSPGVVKISPPGRLPHFFVLMIPLALTSTQWSIRWLGKKWQALHRLIYVTAIAGVIHYIWLVKKDIRKPAIYACILGVLLLYRIVVWAWQRSSTPHHQRRPTDQKVVAAD